LSKNKRNKDSSTKTQDADQLKTDLYILRSYQNEEKTLLARSFLRLNKSLLWI